MTRKDYELIAEVIKNMGMTGYDDAQEYIATEMAKALRDTNPKFDYFRFIEACGVVIT